MLDHLLKDLIKVGRLTVILPDHSTTDYGETSPDRNDDVAVRLEGRQTVWRLGASPQTTLGELYAQGKVTIERGDLDALLNLLYRNLALAAEDRRPLRETWFARELEKWTEPQDYGQSRGNAVMRYFGKEGIYESFLGSKKLQLSAGYVKPGASKSTDYQEAGRRHIAAKLQLKPGQRILDVGAGWGSFGVWLARTFDVSVHGYTLSPEQLLEARRQASEAGVEARVTFEMGDYRKAETRYDRVLAIGSFEHVGAGNYPAYFEHLRNHLEADGVALVHTTGRRSPPQPLNPWVAKHFFPGSHVPALSEIAAAAETSGLWMTDVEVLRFHGAQTLQTWITTLEEDGWHYSQRLDDVEKRRWTFFLKATEMAFKYGELVTYEVQLARHPDVLPMTRDYIEKEEETINEQLGGDPVVSFRRNSAVKAQA